VQRNFRWKRNWRLMDARSIIKLRSFKTVTTVVANIVADR
jgi:hypothetical protein